IVTLSTAPGRMPGASPSSDAIENATAATVLNFRSPSHGGMQIVMRPESQNRHPVYNLRSNFSFSPSG
ncbi:hypothetical protein BD779DRAFT_1543228, partial [Infundibulicybe gibba]